MRKIIQNHIISYYIDKIRILLIAYYIAANTTRRAWSRCGLRKCAYKG